MKIQCESAEFYPSCTYDPKSARISDATQEVCIICIIYY